MKYKNYLQTIVFSILFSLCFTTTIHANVDQTNAFNFEYNCIGGVGTLKTDFNLGGHHHYYRQYQINQPGIIEIADTQHTTVSKNSNISISGCNYKVNTCNVGSMSSWELEKEESAKVITINTDAKITKIGNNLSIDSGKKKKDVTISGFDSIYNDSGKDLEIHFLENKIELIEEGDTITSITFENKTYDGVKSFYYDFTNNNKTITLKKRIFKRGGNGITKSSENTYDVYGAYAGNNFGYPVSGSNNGYHTTMDYWDYTQHHYTTTKIKLHSVDLSCSKTEYSDGTVEISTEAYDGTLGGIINPEFGGDLSFNEKSLDSFGGGVITTTENLTVKGLKYINVGRIGTKNIAVEKIQATLKKNDITLGEDNIVVNPGKETTGEFGTLELTIQNDIGEVITKKAGNYQIVFTFFSNNQQVGTYELPLLIIPNNNLQGAGGISIINNSVYANNEEKIHLCQRINDSFGNSINKDYGNFPTSNVTVTDGIYTNSTNNTGEEAIGISNITFNNSQICFDTISKTPGNKIMKFDIKVPTHKETSTMEWDGKYKTLLARESNSNIVFQKPFIPELKVSNDEGDAWNDRPEIGTKQSYKIDFIKDIPGLEYTLNISESTIKNEIVGHLFKDFSVDGKNIFQARIDANSNILTAPSITTDNIVISYILGGIPVKYYLDNTKISGNDQESLGVRIVGNLQGAGKSELTGQVQNFSDISQSELRVSIRKNAYTLTKSSTSGNIVNGIKYVEGDITLLGDQEYETLIVKNGNVIIAGNIENTLGIIVLKDNYSVESEFPKKGNIYVQADVSYIDAIIYADGGLISADYEGQPYTSDSASRTADLQNQLVLKGSVFTRNTIGGAILAGDVYKLPGESKTTNFNAAMIYDLNYVRRGNKNINGEKNKGYTEPFVIIYNPEVQTNPPKGF